MLSKLADFIDWLVNFLWAISFFWIGKVVIPYEIKNGKLKRIIVKYFIDPMKRRRYVSAIMDSTGVKWVGNEHRLIMNPTEVNLTRACISFCEGNRLVLQNMSKLDDYARYSLGTPGAIQDLPSVMVALGYKGDSIRITHTRPIRTETMPVDSVTLSDIYK